MSFYDGLYAGFCAALVVAGATMLLVWSVNPAPEPSFPSCELIIQADCYIDEEGVEHEIKGMTFREIEKVVE